MSTIFSCPQYIKSSCPQYIKLSQYIKLIVYRFLIVQCTLFGIHTVLSDTLTHRLLIFQVHDSWATPPTFYSPPLFKKQVSKPVLNTGEVETYPIKNLRSSSSKNTLIEIENTLLQHPSSHVISTFELGQINWTMRTLHTLGVGTHHILSPTGGWTKGDLYAEAKRKAHYQLDRLAQVVYEDFHHSTVKRCDWHHLSRIYQSLTPQSFSDGSVHLPAYINFNAYFPCVSPAHISNIHLDSHTQLRDLEEGRHHQVQTALKRASQLSVIEHRGRRAILVIMIDSIEVLNQGGFMGLKENQINKQRHKRGAVHLNFTPHPTPKIEIEGITPSDLKILKEYKMIEDVNPQKESIYIQGSYWRAVRWLDLRSSSMRNTSTVTVQSQHLRTAPLWLQKMSTIMLNGALKLNQKKRAFHLNLNVKDLLNQSKKSGEATRLKRLFNESEGIEVWIVLSDKTLK